MGYHELHAAMPVYERMRSIADRVSIMRHRRAVIAIVRKVGLQQFGHYMMGSANICGKWKTVSGAYGSDGLPMTVDVLPKDAKPLPTELYDAWNKGGGWNGAGSEAAAMAEFAKTLISKR